MTVLDVGTAAGFFSVELARRGAEVTAIDLWDGSFQRMVVPCGRCRRSLRPGRPVRSRRELRHVRPRVLRIGSDPHVGSVHCDPTTSRGLRPPGDHRDDRHSGSVPPKAACGLHGRTRRGRGRPRVLDDLGAERSGARRDGEEGGFRGRALPGLVLARPAILQSATACCTRGRSRCRGHVLRRRLSFRSRIRNVLTHRIDPADVPAAAPPRTAPRRPRLRH